MSVYRKWYCTCSGEPVELDYEESMNDEGNEPFCDLCGASPSSDPKKTLTYEDVEDSEG